MDPLSTVNVDKDTTFIFMIGARRRGHETYFLPDGGISLLEGKLIFDVQEVVPHVNQNHPFDVSPVERLTADEVDAVFIRTDPPFDSAYLMNTWLLDHMPAHIPVINNPAGVRAVNEKVWAARFADLMPRTLITRQKSQYLDFLAEAGKVIVKPTDGFGGAGIFKLEADDSNRAVAFETLSENGAREVIVQEYVPQATVGDKRILLLNGDPLGAVLRVHGEGDHRNNFFAGGTAHPTEITERDQEIIKRLRPHLQELNLHFVGIDVIGDYLIEVNVTSPTCLQEMNKLTNQQLEDDVIAYVEALRAKGTPGQS